MVDALTVARLVALFVQRVETGRARQNKAFILQHLIDQLGFISIFGFVLLVVVLPDVRDVFEEEHGQDVVLIDAGIDNTAKAVAGSPNDFVDVVLLNLLGRSVHVSASPVLVFTLRAGPVARVRPSYVSGCRKALGAPAFHAATSYPAG